MYQLALNLYATLNENSLTPSTELVRVLDHVVCSTRQVLFETFRFNANKIGLNSAENKFYPLNKLIVMDKLAWKYPLYKKHMKLQFLKYGNM